MKAGDRVIVRIARPSEWATGVAESFDNARGVIEEIDTSLHHGGGRKESPILVTFDHPIPRNWTDRPTTAFHFAAADLVKE